MSNAVDRIKGYCTEVNQSQWEELVRVADEVGIRVYAHTEYNNVTQSYHKIASVSNGLNRIPFHDFLAKLRGEEEWTPKAGEMVLIDRGMREENWVQVRFIGYNDAAFVWFDPHSRPTYGEAKIVRPLNYRFTITRAGAEQKLGKRIID